MSNPKLKGKRLGQVVWSAIATETPRNDIAERLYYIEDEYLVKLINDYLKEQ